MDALPELPVMRKWWDSMADLMETNPDHSPLHNRARAGLSSIPDATRACCLSGTRTYPCRLSIRIFICGI